MTTLVIDIESTTFQKGNPFSRKNKLCLLGIASLGDELQPDELRLYNIEYSPEPYFEHLQTIRRRIESADLIVGFNLKFDLNWIKRYVPDIKFPPVWDCQLCYFIDMAQKTPYPSLNDVASHFGLDPKLDVVATEYWAHGVDTPDVPYPILEQYLKRDLELTAEIFKRQYANPEQRSLKELHFKDLLTLVEAEYNGIPVDFYSEDFLKRSQELDATIEDLEKKLRKFFRIENKPWINLHSSEQMSVLLYGGRMYRQELRSYDRVLKSGEISTKERLEWVYDVFPPKAGKPKFQELAATKGVDETVLLSINRERAAARKRPIQRLFSVEESVLLGLRLSVAANVAIKDYIRLKELLKVKQTYFDGLKKLIEDMDWKPGLLHPNYNQCVVATGRLSSSRPNAQNFPEEIRERVTVPDGYSLVEADAKQLEWICVATLANDKVALKEIEDGVDIHEVNRIAFGLPDRLIAKVFVFRLIYGGSAYSYAKDPNFFRVSKREEFWQNVIDKFYAKYRGIHAFHKALVNSVVKNSGKWVSPTGRKYHFDLQGGRNIPTTKILNYPVQGFAADIMAAIRTGIFERLPKGASLIGTVHDSLLFKCKTENVDDIKALTYMVFGEVNFQLQNRFSMELPVPFGVKVKCGSSWNNLKEHN